MYKKIQTDVPMNLNAVARDSYFIRLSDNKEYFLHCGLVDDKKTEYIVKSGLIGAAIFTKKNGNRFIDNSQANNLELIKVTELLNDGSLN